MKLNLKLSFVGLLLILTLGSLMGQDVKYDRYSSFQIKYNNNLQTEFKTDMDYTYMQIDNLPYRSVKKYPFVRHNIDHVDRGNYLVHKNLLFDDPPSGRDYNWFSYRPYNLELVEIRHSDSLDLAILRFVPGLSVYANSSPTHQYKGLFTLYNEHFRGPQYNMHQAYLDYAIATSDPDLSDTLRNRNLKFRKNLLLERPAARQDEQGTYWEFLLLVPLDFEGRGELQQYLEFDRIDKFYIDLKFTKSGDGKINMQTRTMTEHFTYFDEEHEILIEEPIRFERIPVKSYFNRTIRGMISLTTLKGERSHDILMKLYRQHGLYEEWLERCKKCNALDKNTPISRQMELCDEAWVPVK